MNNNTHGITYRSWNGGRAAAGSRFTKFLEELSKVLDIDDYKLGYWAVEEKYEAIKCIRQKCYVIKAEDKLYPTVAGLPKFLAPIINFDNFHHGFTTAGVTVNEKSDHNL